jgi:molybdenum cofactor cytidylyltransferase
MKLTQGLGLNGGETVAFVGAGGKTSAMIALADELPPPVLLTTTTHLGAWQAEFAGRHHIITSPEALQEIVDVDARTVLITGPVEANQRLTGMEVPTLRALHEYCTAHDFSLLIEADGARQRPLKAPADYEPVIPDWVDHVVVMAGLDGLGRSLDDDTVHRPETFSNLVNIQLGEDITIHHLVKVLESPLGGLKGIPAGAARSLFLNQAEGEVRLAQGARIARELGEVYDRVLIGSLKHPGEYGPIFSVHSQTAGIILAAGGSERLGQPKQLLDWGGKPFVVQVAETALTAGLAPIFVVTGSDHELVEESLVSLPVECIYNPKWAEGQSTSMQAGLAALPQGCDRAMILLSDQPQISPLLIRQLVERHNAQRAPITAPMVQDRRGNPVLFGRETFKALRQIGGDQGGRAVFSKFKVDYLTWVDRRAAMDVDQKGDIAHLWGAFFDQT